MSTATPEPLRIGILGAARIAGPGILEPARLLGHRVVAVAARSGERARAFAAEHDVDRPHEGYAALLADPEVDVIYNALVNAAHAEWNLAALAAGKHVLSEKPMTSTAAQARELRDTASEAGLVLAEGFHYLHHPVTHRLRELVTSGALGEITSVDIELLTPPPPADDPRWSIELHGGATMDLGCYVLSALRHTARWLDATAILGDVQARLRAPGLDAAANADFLLATGAGSIPARGTWDMEAPERRMVWTVRGSEATVTAPAYAVPQMDNRVVVTTSSGETWEETQGDRTSYAYQLDAFARSVRQGVPFLVDGDDAVANAELIDAAYRAAGLTARG